MIDNHQINIIIKYYTHDRCGVPIKQPANTPSQLHVLQRSGNFVGEYCHFTILAMLIINNIPRDCDECLSAVSCQMVLLLATISEHYE